MGLESAHFFGVCGAFWQPQGDFWGFWGIFCGAWGGGENLTFADGANPWGLNPCPVNLGGESGFWVGVEVSRIREESYALAGC